MKINLKFLFIFFCILLFKGCVENSVRFETIESDGWTKETKVSKLIENVNFVFPETGYALDNKEEIIQITFDAIKHNTEILGKKEFKDIIYVRVLSSREEMFVYTGTKAVGNTYPYLSTMYIVVNEDVAPPITHELMHLIVMLDWDYPKRSSTWMNEGLATFATNDCSGYNVAEIYRYLLSTNKLIPIEDLVNDFYGQSEMVGYHQSGFIVQYLIENFSWEKFKKLWTDGFEGFEEIYGFSFLDLKNDLDRTVMKKFPEVPKIDWMEFNKGCK